MPPKATGSSIDCNLIYSSMHIYIQHTHIDTFFSHFYLYCMKFSFTLPFKTTLNHFLNETDLKQGKGKESTWCQRNQLSHRIVFLKVGEKETIW